MQHQCSADLTTRTVSGMSELVRVVELDSVKVAFARCHTCDEQIQEAKIIQRSLLPAAHPAARRYYCGRAESAALTHGHDTSAFSSTNFLSSSSLPVSSNEFVIVALPFSTLVIT